MRISGGRVRGLAVGGSGLLLAAALFLPGTAGGVAFAEPTPGPSPTAPVEETPSPEPTCPPVGCVVPTTPPPVVPSATRSPTPKATESSARTSSPKPRRTSSRSPRPQVEETSDGGRTAPPVTPSLDVGGVQPDPSPTPTVEAKDRSSSSGSGDTLARLLVIVLGGALLLGLSGAAGLFLTRNSD